MTKDYAAERELLAMLRIEDGVAYWRESPGPSAAVGSRAGNIKPRGYVSIGFRGQYFQLHRLVFLARHGHLPAEIDHIDGNPANNRVENLRPVTRTQNLWNSRRRNANTSGVKNVSWCARDRRWIVQLRSGGRLAYVARFSSLDEAAADAEQARVETFGEFARHG
jgi:hypothetical protein